MAKQQSEYTKGEWRIEGDCYIIAGEKHKNSLIADITTANDDYEANANLIAKSPRMYELIEKMIKQGGYMYGIDVIKAKKLLAEGKDVNNQ